MRVMIYENPHVTGKSTCTCEARTLHQTPKCWEAVGTLQLGNLATCPLLPATQALGILYARGLDFCCVCDCKGLPSRNLVKKHDNAMGRLKR